MFQKLKKIAETAFFRPGWYSIFINPYFIARRGLYKNIRNYAQKDFSQKTILDVGCGIKPYQHLFSEAKEYIGIDIQGGGHLDKSKMVDAYYDGRTIPFENERFDIAICTQVLEHAEDPERLLAEIHRVLKGGGEVFVTVPFVWNEHEIPYDFRRWTRFGLKALFVPLGFQIAELRTEAGVFRVVGQLISGFIFETLGRNILGKVVAAVVLCFPVQLFFIILDFIFRNSWINLDYVLVARKSE